jgi:hypothetical protein
MLALKVLGSIDLANAIAFLMLTFGVNVLPSYIMFCGGLLFIKGMFILRRDLLSILDIFSAIFLFLSLLVSLPTILLWTSAFLLLAKGVASFV